MALLLSFVLISALRSVLAELSVSLDFNCSTVVERDIYRRGYGTTDGLPQVYKSLINCPDTESLRLRLHNYEQNPEKDLLNFEFLTGDRFPQLREVSLDGYDFGGFRLVYEPARLDQAQAIMKPILCETAEASNLPPSQLVYKPGANIDAWIAAMDWGALRSLELSNVDNIFFWKMKGNLPALKNLTVINNHGRSNVTDYMTDFITALSPLTNLSTNGYTSSINWSHVLGRHGSTLNRLEIQDWNAQRSQDSRPTLSIAQLEEISRQSPGLSELSVKIKMDDKIPHESLDALALNNNLTKLTIRLRGNVLRNELNTEHHSYKSFEGPGSLHDEEEAESSFISPQTILQIFQYLRTRKRRVELLQLEVYVGNYGLRYGGYRPDWVEGYDMMPSKHVCSVLDDEGNRKVEGEAWCYCQGVCRENEPWYSAM